MADHRVKLNLAGLNVVMRAAQPQLDQVGRRMAAAAGEGFEYVPSPHPYTARGFVQTASARGRRREAIDKVLVRTLTAGS
jgi:hypothetical protein